MKVVWFIGDGLNGRNADEADIGNGGNNGDFCEGVSEK